MDLRHGVCAIVLVGAAGLAAGCAGGGGQVVTVGAPSSTTAAATTAAAPTTAAPAPATTPRTTTPVAAAGPRPEALGAPATVTSGAAVRYTFSIDSVQPDPTCTGGATAGADHLLLVRVTLHTTAAFAPGSLDLFDAAGSLRVVAPDGTVTRAVQTRAATGCASQGGTVPDPVRASAGYAFGFVLESPVTTGTLVYAPAGSSGWQWAFGA